MGETGKGKNRLKTVGKYLSRFIVAVVCAVVFFPLALGIYLTTPLPARQVSHILTSFLHQKLTVDRVQTAGGTLYLRGVRLGDPPGFSQGNLAEADSVAIAPIWGDLLLGRRRFRLVALDGVRINLEKNSRGAWNFGQLQRLFAGQKPSATETCIRQFIVRDVAVKVDGRGVQGGTLQVFNLATKGSLSSRIDLSFEDAVHNRFSLKGVARSGTDPSLDLTLMAPELPPRDVASLFGLKRPDLVEGGLGSLQLNASWHKELLSAGGKFVFSHARLIAAGKTLPLAGELEFAADYDLRKDAGRLRTCTLTVNNLLKVHAVGTGGGLKRERRFALDVGLDEVDLGVLNALMPEKTRRNLVFGGWLGCEAFHLAGNRSLGVTDASGTLQLRDGTLTRGGRLLLARLSGTVGFSRNGGGILAKGRFSQPGLHGKAVLESLEMPFNLALSRRMKPLRAEVPSFSARLYGIPFSGRLALDASKESPLTASVKVPHVELLALNSLPERYDLNTTAGTASVLLDVAGKNLQEMSAAASVQLLNFRGSRGKTTFGAGKGSVAVRMRRGGGHLLVQGEAQLNPMAFNEKPGYIRFRYKIADSLVYLDDADLSLAGAQVSLAHLMASIADRKSIGKLARYPVALEVNGGTVKLGELEVRSLAGRFRGSLASDPAGRWLEGAAEFASGSVVWQGGVAAAPAARVVFSRRGARGELKGQVLGGTLAGSVSCDPFAPEAGGTFDLGIKDADLAVAAPFIPKHPGISVSDGLVELRSSGRYSGHDGLTCRFASKGSRIALGGAGGKTLLSGAEFRLAGTLAGARLSIGDAVLSIGAGVALKLQGEFAHPLSAKRTGGVTFSLPETAASNIVDPLVNLLPRFIQEATVGGTVALDGKLDLREGRKLLDGSLVFKGGRLEMTKQKFVVAGINGKFPFSLDLSEQAGAKPRGSLNFSRENYPLLLEQLRRGTGGGQVVTVAGISLGALQLGTLTMRIAAGNGSTEIVSLNAPLYEGALSGRGFVTMRGGLGYRGDLLVNSLSLKKLCSIFPDIKGYISGRVDGVISLSGGVHGLNGFAELWAREGSGEKMLVSKEFLQRMSKQKLSGFFFRNDRPYDQAELKAVLEEGDLTFETLKIVHTNLIGVRDLSVSIAPAQNRIALDHLLDSIRQASLRGKPATGEPTPAEAPVTPEFKWGE